MNIELRKELIEFVKWHEMDKTEWTDNRIEQTVDVYLIFNEKQLKLTSVSNSHSICDNCSGVNVAWGTTDELWNKIADHPKKSICPQCFISMAQIKLNYENVIIVFDAKLIGR